MQSSLSSDYLLCYECFHKSAVPHYEYEGSDLEANRKYFYKCSECGKADSERHKNLHLAKLAWYALD